jgi:pilus assembly protein CpaF
MTGRADGYAVNAARPQPAAMEDAGKRFSPSAYAALLQISGSGERDAPGDGEGRALADIRALTEEIRHILAVPRGWNEEERRRYTEKLNRAIIGFPAERAEILAFISDWIIKRKLNHLPLGSLPYGSLAEALFAEVIGMNVLELILRDRADLEEIQVVGTQIFEVRGGRVTISPYRFDHIGQVERIQQNLVLFNNDRISPRKRWAEVRLLDGSRVTMTGFGFTALPTLTIRFYTVKHLSLEALCRPEYATIDEEVFRLLRVIVRSRFNMVVIGATNTGKTHLIKALLAEIPDEERIVTFESRFELMLKRDFPEKNVVEFEIDEDDPLHGPRQAFKLALRQSPSRICHTEIRDEDANLYVRACTRGHEGSITSVHANSLEDVPDAITDMCMLDGRGMNPDRLLRRIVEHVTQIGMEMRLVGDRRKLVRIGELEYRGGLVTVRDLALYDEAADCWRFPMPFSARASQRIRRWDPEGYRMLLERGGVTPC